MRINNSLIFIVSFLIFMISVLQMPHVVDAAKLPGGSKVATISVEKLTDEAAKEKIEKEINSWQSGEPLVLKSDYEKFLIPRSAVVFDIDATIAQLNEKTKRQMNTFFLRQKNIHIPLLVQIDSETEEVKQLEEIDYILAEKTIQNILDLASELEEKDVSIVYDKNKEIKQEKIVEKVVPIPDGLSNSVLTYAVDELNGTTIQPKSPFSMLRATEILDSLGEATKEQSFLASILYSLALQTNFEIVVREQELRQPNYAENGIYAYINRQENKDLIIQNPNDFSFKIKVSQTEDELTMSLHSYPLQESYSYEVKQIEEINERTMYRYSRTLKPGERQTVQAGTKGFSAEVYRNQHDKDGYVIDSELISREFSLPKPHIILVSTKTNASEELVPDSDLEARENVLNQFINLFDNGRIENITELEQLLDEMEQELIEAETDLEVELATAREALKLVQRETKESIKHIQNEIDKYPSNLQQSFEGYMTEFLTVSNLLQQGNKKAAKKKIDQLTIEFNDILQSLDNPVYRAIIEAIANDRKASEG